MVHLKKLGALGGLGGATEKNSMLSGAKKMNYPVKTFTNVQTDHTAEALQPQKYHCRGTSKSVLKFGYDSTFSFIEILCTA